MTTCSQGHDFDEDPECLACGTHASEVETEFRKENAALQERLRLLTDEHKLAIEQLLEESKKARNYKGRKDAAYEERNRVVALLLRIARSLGWKAGIGAHVDVADGTGEEWDPEWRTIVTVDLPTGQGSWHVHDSQKKFFEGLPAYDGVWDGHDTKTKYERVEKLVQQMDYEAKIFTEGN